MSADPFEESVVEWTELWDAAKGREQTRWLLAKARERGQDNEALCGLLRSQNPLLAPRPVPVLAAAPEAAEERTEAVTVTAPGADFG